MSNKEFDFDAFNKVLQSSKNICDGARKDIERAIKAGKGEASVPAVFLGQVWADDGDQIFQVQAVPGLDNGRYFEAYLSKGNEGCHGSRLRTLSELYDHFMKAGYVYKADTLSQYLAQGGKL